MEEITENPYLKYFIGLPGYQAVPPFVPSLLVEFRKRLTADVLCEINEMIIEYNTPDDPTPGGGNPTEADAEGGNTGTLILDATCAPQKITFPQDRQYQPAIYLPNRKRESSSVGRIWGKAGAQGHYLERVLADKIYLNRANLGFCKDHGIRLSDPSLGRPRKNAMTDKKTEYMDNAGRVAVEQAFALAKSKYGLGLIISKLDQTTRSAIVMSVMAMNVDRIYRSLLRFIVDIVLSRYTQREFILELI